MTPLQIKLAAYGGALLLLWLLHRSGSTNAEVPRVAKTLDVVDDVNSPYFGMTDAEIAAVKANPAVDPTMRMYIDRSNLLIAKDDLN